MTQNGYARLAGFLYLWLIITGLTGALTASRIAGSGTFAESAKRVVASATLYRAAIATELIETLSALLLGFALYVTLKPADELLARLGMYFRIAESIVGGVGIVIAFAKLRVYTATPLVVERSQWLMDVLRGAGYACVNISAIFFSIGSIVFSYVFYKSRYVPRIVSAFSVFASVVVTLMCFAMLIVPDYGGKLQYGWAPMAIAEVTIGIWLMVFGVRNGATADRRSHMPALEVNV